MKKLAVIAREMLKVERAAAPSRAAAAFYRAEAETWVAQAKGK
jgi:hypothetical protein